MPTLEQLAILVPVFTLTAWVAYIVLDTLCWIFDIGQQY